MKVLHVISRIENSGPNKVLLSLARGQKELGTDVTVASMQPERDDPGLVKGLRDLGIAVVPIATRWSRDDINNFSTLSAQFEVTHVHCLRSLMVASCARARKLVVTSHNIPDEDWPLTKGPVLGRIIGGLHYLLMARADKIVAINERMRARIAARGGDVVLLGNPVTLPSSRQTRTAAAGPIRRLLCVGHLNSRKNQGLLLEALALMGPAAYGLQLDILGEGPTRPTLEARARELPCQVNFVGFVTDPTPWFVEAELYVSPALSEGQPIAVLEALGSGLPCLLSDIPGHAFPDPPPDAVEIFRNDAPALAEALTRLTRMPAACPPDTIVAWARQKFAPQVVARRYLDLYAALF